MRQISILFLSLIIGTPIISAKTSVWKISKDNNVIYLGGSIHTLRAEDYPLPGAFDIAFDLSDRIILETDIEQMGNPETSYSIMQKSILPEGKTLKNMLKDSIYHRLEEACNLSGMNIAEMQQIKPSILITFLTVAKMQQLGFSPQGVDSYYFERAKTFGKKLDYLESIEYQIDVLTNMGIGYENEFVLYSLEDLNHVEDGMMALLNEWKNGTSTEMESQLNEMQETFPAVYKSMMPERNNAWVPQIIRFLSEKEATFVIVGLAHMYGEDGLLRQLKEAGCSIEQME